MLAALVWLLALGHGVACGGEATRADTASARLQKARALAERAIIVDTHIDFPLRMLRKWVDVSGRLNTGQFDYVRARRGGLDVAFMSIYVPSEMEQRGGARQRADTLIAVVRKMAATWPDKFGLVTSASQVPSQAGTGRVLLAMGMENGSPLEGDVGNVRGFYAKGIRYITLAHAKSNRLADASYDSLRPWNGLSPFGRQVVAEMNNVGIMVDISHLSDSAAFQAIRLSRAPVIASHSSCRHFTPGFERNMSDEMIRELASRGGVLQINFGSTFVSDVARLETEKREQDLEHYIRNSGAAPKSKQAAELARQYRRAHPFPHANVADVAAHVDHVIRLVGPDHVGLGSDFDGVGDTLPVGLKDVSEYPNLLAELLRLGYDDETLRKICGGNLLRVWSAVEHIAREGGTR